MKAYTTSVLLVQDDPETAGLILSSLEQGGYEVYQADRALRGLDIARTLKPDVVITELELPDMSGRELATSLRADPRFSQIPIIALIPPYTNAEQRELCLVAGITGFIEQPIQPEALPIQVQFYLSGGTEEVTDDERLDVARTRYMQEFVTRLELRIRELEIKNQDLERLDHMKDTFIQLTAHELRTPLTLITGYSRLLEDHPPLQELMQHDESIAMLIGGLSESIGRMQSIIEEILTISRIMTSQIELNIAPVNLGALVRRAIKRYAIALEERKIRIHFEDEQWPTAMRADGDLLQLTLMNLVSNAIKYTPDGGEITLNALYNEQMVRFSVRDTGIGIAKADQQTIFTRMRLSGNVALHSTSKTAFNGGGLGLGLAICHGIVTAHGGKIWVESRGQDPQKLPGSEFMVILPLVARPTKNEIVRKLMTRNVG